jgi:hypothetical protein
MPQTAKTLRDRIALFRRLLSEAVDADLAAASWISKDATRTGHRNAMRAIWSGDTRPKIQPATIKNELMPIGSAHANGLRLTETLSVGSPVRMCLHRRSLTLTAALGRRNFGGPLLAVYQSVGLPNLHCTRAAAVPTHLRAIFYGILVVVKIALFGLVNVISPV